MSLKKLFGNNIPPDCRYCRYYIKKAGSNPVCRYGAMSFEQKVCIRSFKKGTEEPSRYTEIYCR